MKFFYKASVKSTMENKVKTDTLINIHASLADGCRVGCPVVGTAVGETVVGGTVVGKAVVGKAVVGKAVVGCVGGGVRVAGSVYVH